MTERFATGTGARPGGIARRIAAALVFGIAGCAVLLGLGVWQIQRLAWKEDILARIEARLAAEPVALPAAPTEAADQYRRVAVSGRIAPGEARIYTALRDGGGVGYRIVVPLETEDGRRILLDRGFVPDHAANAPRLVGPITVEGALLWPDEVDRFTPDPDPEADLWFARDVPALARHLDTDPVLLVTATSDDPAQPRPLPVTVAIPNNHLEYAITWFGLAAVWAGMTAYLIWRIRQRTV